MARQSANTCYYHFCNISQYDLEFGQMLFRPDPNRVNKYPFDGQQNYDLQFLNHAKQNDIRELCRV